MSIFFLIFIPPTENQVIFSRTQKAHLTQGFQIFFCGLVLFQSKTFFSEKFWTAPFEAVAAHLLPHCQAHGSQRKNP